jgi:hypothetical protein
VEWGRLTAQVDSAWQVTHHGDGQECPSYVANVELRTPTATDTLSDEVWITRGENDHGDGPDYADG